MNEIEARRKLGQFIEKELEELQIEMDKHTERANRLTFVVEAYNDPDAFLEKLRTSFSSEYDHFMNDLFPEHNVTLVSTK